jgi:hypothetical protein
VEPHGETGPISGSLRERQRQTHKRRGIRSEVRIRPLLHATKVFRQHKQQRDHGEEDGKLEIDLSFFFILIKIKCRVPTLAVAICVL